MKGLNDILAVQKVSKWLKKRLNRDSFFWSRVPNNSIGKIKSKIRTVNAARYGFSLVSFDELVDLSKMWRSIHQDQMKAWTLCRVLVCSYEGVSNHEVLNSRGL
jgi:hypothetical protein